MKKQIVCFVQEHIIISTHIGFQLLNNSMPPLLLLLVHGSTVWTFTAELCCWTVQNVAAAQWLAEKRSQHKPALLILNIYLVLKQIQNVDSNQNVKGEMMISVRSQITEK